MTDTFPLSAARSAPDLEAARELFIEYTESLGVDLRFQNVDAELADLPGKYAEPDGIIVLAHGPFGEAVGCAALRPLDEPGCCEIKRLYVRPQARGAALGRRLALAVIAHARRRGYERMLLDTLPGMNAAQGLYRDLGFGAIEPYYDNPIRDTVFLELRL
ncbi:acetyltransferase (GNAT) family protein [Hoeflea marina]|uniref:Acetyltransferase (GNAT) family protein n=1 Tax=Hoeflea marina TaxID=274592 RepID=A0A317PPV4_9HYPH|nr:GNAT family N-acetyltransferase [Hoeflea marina]PWW03502.1 acetyltransferase (GNAT) family protein [Hoeflea marina]